MSAPATAPERWPIGRAVPAALLAGGALLVVVDVALAGVTVDVPRSAAGTAAGIPFWVHAAVGLCDLAGIAIGTLIVARRPDNAVGWIVLVASIGFPLTDAADSYVHWSLHVAAGRLPGTTMAAWMTNWSWILTSLAVPFLLLLFPDGRPPGHRWAPVLWVAAANVVAITLVVTLLPGPLDAFPQLDNPVGVSLGGVRGPTDMEGVLRMLFDVHLVVSVLALLSLLWRYRYGSEVERRQLHWLLYAAVVLLVVINVTPSLTGPAASELVEAVAGLGLIMAITVAILRHRLYEIDRIISRTATYAIVWAVLATVYAVVAVVPSTVFRLDSDLLVAAATLAAAAVFVPLRRRVQSVVDRRFNRARYDAQQVVDRFSSRLRSDVDVTHLTDDLRSVVGATVQPAHVTLWLARDGS